MTAISTSRQIYPTSQCQLLLPLEEDYLSNCGVADSSKPRLHRRHGHIVPVRRLPWSKQTIIARSHSKCGLS